MADEPNEASAGISIKEAADTTVEAVEDARIIGADKDVLTLRRNADELYRVLFGDNAFNQQSMNSALEVTLPPLTGE